MGKLSRTKGHSYERTIANRFKELYPEARRKLEYQSQVIDGTDVECVGDFAIQCKRYKSYAPISKIFEITAKDKINLLITKGDRLPDMVVLSLDDFFKLMKEHKNE